MLHLKRFFLTIWFGSLLISNGFSQSKAGDTSATMSIAAGPEYKKSKGYQKLWGRNWRSAWTTEIRVPYLWLDKTHGGLTPSTTSGGNETKGLRLTSATGKEYSLRSVNKSRAEVVAKEFKHTFIEKLIQDGISMSQPYGASALPVMEKNAGIYHAEPILVYLPKQPALDTLNEEYGDDLYMIEQRYSGDWSEADNLGNFKEFLSTDEVVTKMAADNKNRPDQREFAKARLFDMMIADWDRHEDQWKWGERKIDDRRVFIPIPKDRDQAFFVHNGILIDKGLSAIGNGYMQSFDRDSKNIAPFNFEERYMDPYFANELTVDDWVNAAKDLQQSLTDAVIEQSIRQLPSEIFSVSGTELIAKLKSRRAKLVTYATQYYPVLAKEVEITGSMKKEFFEIKTLEGGATSVRIFRINGEGNKDDIPFYSRVFKPEETNFVRIFGIGGKDIYSIEGDEGPIHISIIGGADEDSYLQNGSNRIHIYDDRKNKFEALHSRLHLSADSAVHTVTYTGRKTDMHDVYGKIFSKKGLKPSFSYNNADRFYVGIGYGITNYKWRRDPFASQQLIDLHYSVSQKAFSVTYTALFPNLIGKKWNLTFTGNYDAVRWINFFGIGNDVTLPVYNKNFFRMRTVEWSGEAGLNRQFGKSNFAVTGFFQSIKIKADTGRYIAKVYLPINNDAYETNNYAGAQLTYTHVSLNDSVVPTRGITFFANASFFSNVVQKEFFQRYLAKLRAYLPLGNKFSLAIKAGASTVVCKSGILNTAEFYEHAVIGGPESLRGYRRERFWGKTAYYNTNELRFITKIRTRLLNAKAGIFVFFDDGRVWMPGENSSTIHTGYGPGILFAPFSKIMASVSYGISKESRLFHISVSKLF